MDVFDALMQYNYPAVSGLQYRNQFTFLVAIILSAQAQDTFVNTQTPALFDAASNAHDMYALGLEQISFYVQRIGLWRNKAKNIHILANQIMKLQEILQQHKQKCWYDDLCEKFYSSRACEMDDMKTYNEKYDENYISSEGIPTFRFGLLQLAGIGRKSANVFLNVVYDAPCFPVDTHVMRLVQRLGLVDGQFVKTPVDIEERLQEIVPEKYAKTICHALVWHGRRVCFAKKPNCEQCLLKEWCKFWKTLKKNHDE